MYVSLEMRKMFMSEEERIWAPQIVYLANFNYLNFTLITIPLLQIHDTFCSEWTSFYIPFILIIIIHRDYIYIRTLI